MKPRAAVGQLLILTGERGAGKTTACLELVESARRQWLDCAGLACPARFEGGSRAGIDVIDLRTNERRGLAVVDELPARLRAGPYRFDETSVSWGVARLAAACPCDLLVVDEIGPLEMVRREGWVDAVEILRRGDYSLAVAVVRPSLVESVRAAVGGRATEVVEKREGDDEAGSRLEVALSTIERTVPRPP